MSATECVVACGCEMARVISAVLGVFVGGWYCARNSYVGGGNLDLNSIVLLSTSRIILSYQ